MDPVQIKENTKQIIGAWPNTYTFSKYLAEKALFKYRGNLNVFVARPSIINAALSDPFPGWTDTTSAGGAVALVNGLGICPFFLAKSKPLDMVPVDIVAKTVIVGTAYIG